MAVRQERALVGRMPVVVEVAVPDAPRYLNAIINACVLYRVTVLGLAREAEIMRFRAEVEHDRVEAFRAMVDPLGAHGR